MSYHRDKGTHPIVDSIFSLAVVGLILAIVYGTSFIPWLSGASHSIFNGGLKGKVAIDDNIEATRDILSSSRKSMAEYIESLEHNTFTLRAKVLDYDRLESENEVLRETLNASSGVNSVVTTTRILKRPPTSSYDTLVIDSGTDDNVTAGQTVVAFGALYLGNVVEVFSDTSVVRLATTQDVVRDVQSVRNGVVLEAKGHNGSHVVIEMPRDIDVVEGDQFKDVLSNKLSLVVYKITFDDREPFKTVYARSPVNIRYLDWVQVIR
jgi:cell shape-determining protein MreC